MICMNYDHNKKFGLLKFHSGYGKFYFNSPKGYNRKIINAQTDFMKSFLQNVRSYGNRMSLSAIANFEYYF